MTDDLNELFDLVVYARGMANAEWAFEDYVEMDAWLRVAEAARVRHDQITGRGDAS